MKELIIEAQSIPAPERHNKIFNAFDSLETGDSIVIVNNHDPKPLISEFDKLRKSEFESIYLESGPTSWKVKLTKTKKEGCCGCC
jgi:uncharacterized protein (DUF2249 family)